MKAPLLWGACGGEAKEAVAEEFPDPPPQARPPLAFPEALRDFVHAEMPPVVAEVLGADGVLAEGGAEQDAWTLALRVATQRIPS
ncbi:hypothetical protein ACSSS7_004969 [Eimeria intestinalis]